MIFTSITETRSKNLMNVKESNKNEIRYSLVLAKNKIHEKINIEISLLRIYPFTK